MDAPPMQQNASRSRSGRATSCAGTRTYATRPGSGSGNKPSLMSGTCLSESAATADLAELVAGDGDHGRPEGDDLGDVRGRLEVAVVRGLEPVCDAVHVPVVLGAGRDQPLAGLVRCGRLPT